MRADIAQAEDSGPVRDDGNKISFVRMGKHALWMLRNLPTGGSHSGCVPDSKIVQIANRNLWDHRQLPLVEGVESQGIGTGFLGLEEQLFDIGWLRHFFLAVRGSVDDFRYRSARAMPGALA